MVVSVCSLLLLVHGVMAGDEFEMNDSSSEKGDDEFTDNDKKPVTFICSLPGMNLYPWRRFFLGGFVLMWEVLVFSRTKATKKQRVIRIREKTET